MFGMSIHVIDPTAIDHGVILRGRGNDVNNISDV
jgi:hypothetical protein